MSEDQLPRLQSVGTLSECESCGSLFEQDSAMICNYCVACAGKAFLGVLNNKGERRMTTYAQATEEAPTMKELLELSTLYHNHIRELAELWDVSLTPATRAQAFQIVMNFGEQLKMKTLAAAVLAEINQKETNDENS